MVCFPHYIPCFLLIIVIISLAENLSLFVHLESRAIIRYIATKYHDVGTSLYGRTLQEKATIEQWLEVEAQNYNPLLSIGDGTYYQPTIWDPYQRDHSGRATCKAREGSRYL